ncbi:hypothetical protein PIB30_071519 [Stylosanthes scabra]|uniref:Uncharacterized protein n=1 Tax=Stylosanthes scabra TaxID=79078 RepID=A0ABU6YLD4_9FABA|nr:hypothetical protein [Stylosanthes scabra]
MTGAATPHKDHTRRTGQSRRIRLLVRCCLILKLNELYAKQGKPEEAWEMIETVADANQHFSTKAKNSSIHEIAPSESTFLMKSLSDIAAMLKEIKEGQLVMLVTLKQQADNSQQKPIKYCGICSCKSHHMDDCLQIQEDNTIAAAQNFVDFTIIPPNNKQYHIQGPNDQPV